MIRCINESTNIHKNLFEVSTIGYIACKDIYSNSSSEESGLDLDNIHARITIIVLQIFIADPSDKSHLLNILISMTV